ncbi:methyltransferase domain-containing protein [Aestuariirhabdus sp. Z084]|uniref:putative RNA methyltransferase n=1 Tax=Aestuariirhabdus haliotis TaxID=2918751 RepID=UPI00201B3C8F|nr:methyltransferase domain-containing protein [Aestuariirhabdus haliotis]MCL6417395.1 methyltransferase domain-containing protein [Aestuariirhabdus haliotis]MCL6421339.1 methyltransferase domain-containing protein [Aestuariirhabdus haliotis]
MPLAGSSFAHSAGWQCPHCQEELALVGNSWQCINRHSFDRAKQGYVNLLPSHRKQSKQPGDNAEMVTARSRFLGGGHYQPLLLSITSMLKTHLAEANGSWLDAGCGEGWYTAALQQQLPAMQGFAIDISKPAIGACCRRSKSIQWAVASVADVPLCDHTMSFILSVFSRIDWGQFERILANEGLLLAVTPGQHHLLELRQAIYDEVRLHEEEKVLKQLPESFQCVATERCEFSFTLEGSEQMLDLLAMTPHYWHINPEQKQRLIARKTLTTRADFKLELVRKQH